MSDTIDTPDYQRGVVSAQTLLADVGPGVDEATVGVPPNAETIVLFGLQQSGGSVPSVRGVQTHMFYPLMGAGFLQSGERQVTAYVDAARVVDSEVTVFFPPVAGTKWYLYADAGVHIVSSPQLTGAADALVETERLFSSRTFTASGLLLEPLTDFYFKLFTVQIVRVTGNDGGSIVIGGTTEALALVGIDSTCTMSFPPAGYDLKVNTGLEVIVKGSSGEIFASVGYASIEAV